jgi:hypothetical protein
MGGNVFAQRFQNRRHEARAHVVLQPGVAVGELVKQAPISF